MQLSGTSFSAPVVAGAAAQILAGHPSSTPDQVKGALMVVGQAVPNAPVGSARRGRDPDRTLRRIHGLPAEPEQGARQVPRQRRARRREELQQHAGTTRPRQHRPGTLSPGRTLLGGRLLDDVSWTDVAWSDVAWARSPGAMSPGADVAWSDTSSTTRPRATRARSARGRARPRSRRRRSWLTPTSLPPRTPPAAIECPRDTNSTLITDDGSRSQRPTGIGRRGERSGAYPGSRGGHLRTEKGG